MPLRFITSFVFFPGPICLPRRKDLMPYTIQLFFDDQVEKATQAI
jgi:hypothetical protein